MASNSSSFSFWPAIDRGSPGEIYLWRVNYVGLTEALEGLFKFRDADLTVTVLIKIIEHLSPLVFREVVVLGIGHQGHEFIEVDCARAIDVDDLDDSLDLILQRSGPTQDPPHEGLQF